MADKKITELTLLSDSAQNDRLVIVDDPLGTPITKQITVSKLFGNVNFITDTTTNSVTLIKSTLVANTTAASSVIAGDFSVTSTDKSQNTPYQYGLRVTSAMSTATAKITNEHATAKFILNVSNAAPANVISNTYVALFEVANTAARAANVTSFIRLQDTSGIAAGTTTAQVLYLLDANGVSQNTTGTSGNVDVLFSNASSSLTANRVLKIRVNETDVYLLASTTP